MFFILFKSRLSKDILSNPLIYSSDMFKLLILSIVILKMETIFGLIDDYFHISFELWLIINKLLNIIANYISLLIFYCQCSIIILRDYP